MPKIDIANNYDCTTTYRVYITLQMFLPESRRFFFYPKGDWIYRDGHYYSHRGKLAANSWFTAEGLCRQHGETVHLASIHSQQENDFIKSLSSDGGEQWIGLTDHNTQSNLFKWIDRSPYRDFSNWAPNEPNHATVDEDCGAMKPDGKWIDVACRKQRLESNVHFDRRAFTCKTSGKKTCNSLGVNIRVKPVFNFNFTLGTMSVSKTMSRTDLGSSVNKQTPK